MLLVLLLYTANRMPSFTHHHPATQHQLVNAGKCHQNYINSNYIQNNNHSSVRLLDKHLLNYDQQELTQELCAAVLQQQENNQANTKVPQEQSSSSTPRILQQSNQETFSISNNSTIAQSWHSALTSTSTVADYLSNLPASTLPLSLQHFLKYSAENLKKDSINYSNSQNNNLLLQGGQTNSNTVNVVSGNTSNNNHNILTTGNNYQSSINLNTINTAYLHTHMAIKKKKKKKIEKEKKPRPKPGEIRLTTALDGSTLYCCPECHMAYPEKELLEQHIVGHTMERRFVCDICGAGLKRKDHLTRHKQSHNPERPFVCTVCLKAFKRKEQLTLHFVIHSGEKRHICSECGKGFYRKDHLRKHTRSHIARRVKAELSQHGNGEGIDNINLHIVSTATVRDANNGLQLG